MRVGFWSVALWLLLVGVIPGFAQQVDLLAAHDPASVQAARAGDPQAAFELGQAKAQPNREADLRAAKPWLVQAQRDAKALTPANPRLAGAGVLVLGRIHDGLSKPRAALDFATEAEPLFRSLPHRPKAMATALSWPWHWKIRCRPCKTLNAIPKACP